MLAIALTLFTAGLLTILLPCILPLLPIVLGVSATDRSKVRPLVTIGGMLVSFVGITFLFQVVLNQFVELADYIRLGTFVVLMLFGFGFAFHDRRLHWLGAVLGALLLYEKGPVAVIVAAVLGVVAMEVGSKIASRLQQLGSDVQQSARSEFGSQSLLTAFIIGLTLGLVWAPCAGPALGFAFTLVREEPGLKALFYLSMYGLGTAVPLLLITYGGQMAIHGVRALSQYSGRIKQCSGILLILTAIALRFDLFLPLQQYGSIGSTLEEKLFGNGNGGDAFLGASSKLPVLGIAPPAFVNDGPWHNSPPLKLADLRGKVVLIDFWTYSCINCIRTLPYIRAYWDKYKSQPFVLIGVHSPEFVFEKSEKNVSDAIKKYQLTYPIVQDNDFGTWSAFKNRYWPAKYLIDAEGQIRYVHFGEGGYEETDKAIQSLLDEMGMGSEYGLPVADGEPKEGGPLTPETYLGSRSWDALANQKGAPSAAVITYTAPASLAINDYSLAGTWQLVDDERQVLRSDVGEIRLHALAGEVNLVLGLEDGAAPVEATVMVDGKEHRSFPIDRPDLYTLFQGDYGEHDVLLKLKGKDVSAYAFTFGP